MNDDVDAGPKSPSTSPMSEEDVAPLSETSASQASGWEVSPGSSVFTPPRIGSSDSDEPTQSSPPSPLSPSGDRFKDMSETAREVIRGRASSEGRSGMLESCG